METTTHFFEGILGIKSPWHVTKVSHDQKENRVDLYVEHDKSTRFPCPKCKEFCSVYDHTQEREFRHLNVFHMPTYIHLRIPRVQCKTDGVQQIEHGLAEPNGTVTYEFEKLIIDFEHECSIESISRLLSADWHLCQSIQERAVERGRQRKGKVIPRRMGVDEKSFAKGHKYETIVYDIDKGTIEEVIDNREQKSLESYYKQFTVAELDKIETVAMDMWDPYIAATKACVPGADGKIVFDHYHITRIISKAVDKVRKEENQRMIKSGFDLLTGTKYLWLWNEENVPEFRREEFDTLRSMDLNVCRAYAIKENLRNLWSYNSAGWMRRFFKAWYFWATHSRLKPIVDAAKSIESHFENIVTYAKHKVTNALAESLNSKIEKVKRIACGYRNRTHYKIAIFFHCGGLDLYPARSLTLCQVLT